MARDDRPREPRPEREHPIGRALYALNREGFGVLYHRILADGANPTAEMRQYEKGVLLAQIDRVRAMVDAI